MSRREKQSPPPNRKPAGSKSSYSASRRPSGPPGWLYPALFATVIIAVAGGSIWYKMRPASKADNSTGASAIAPQDSTADVPFTPAPTMTANTGPDAGYAGSASCATCHQGIAETYSHIAMGRSLYPPTPQNIVEDYITSNTYAHAASGMEFRMTHEGDKFYQTSYQRGPTGDVINENKVRIDYIVGSGNNSRSYLHREENGALYQLPIAWYAENKNWAMNPGYDNGHHVNFSRRITYDCLFCHAAYPDVPAGADRYNYGESAFFPEKLEAIDCERCHGPAAQHVALAQAGKASAEEIRKSIVNPAHLSNERQLETCMQCHLETTSGQLPHSVHTLGKGIFGYRPGEPLEAYRYAFDHPPGTGHDDKFEIAGQAYRMRMSACFIKSEGKMTCTTCHDPHKVPIDRIEAGIQSCFECHKPADCTEKMDVRLAAKDNCIQCHMPRRRTDDVIHAVMTDHFIQRRPPPADQLLAPRQEHAGDYKGEIVNYYPKEIAPELRDLYMGFAYISNSADLDKGVKHLDAYIAKNPANFPAVYTRGVAYKMLSQMDAARTELEKAVRLEPSQPQAWMALGDLYEMTQRYDRSADCYRRAQKIDPRLARAFNGEGTSLLMAGKLDEAEKAFKTAMLRDPFDENPRLNLAGIYLRKNNMKAAEAEAKAALAINPNVPDGWMHLAQCALAGDRPAEAIWNALQCLAGNPQSEQAFQVLNAACRAAKPAAAIPALAAGGARAPFASYILTSLNLLEQGTPGAAADYLTSASRVSTAPAALATACHVAMLNKRPDLAVTWGEQAYAAQPQSDEALIRLATALQATGGSDRANQLLTVFIAKQRSPRALNALAWLKATTTQDALRNGTEAAQLASEAAKMLGKPNIFVLQSMAAAAAEQGDFAQAEAMAADALNQATAAGLTLDARQIEAQLFIYKAKKPYRQ